MTILSFQSFLFIETFFSFQIILFLTSQHFVSTQKNVIVGDMTSINNYFCRVTFRALYTCIERLLCLLQVKSLVLLAIEGVESLWKNKFKFHKNGTKGGICLITKQRITSFFYWRSQTSLMTNTKVINQVEHKVCMTMVKQWLNQGDLIFS